jgi:tripartite-type tricarboxylate transporter receptor subunit TctC
MTLERRTFLRLAIAAAALAATPQIAWAQAYPTRPVTLIVPFPPGGSTDVAARIVADHMSRTLGQQVVIQNVSGAGGTTGSTRAMRAEPDGYTILMGQMGTHAASVALYPNLAYKPERTSRRSARWRRSRLSLRPRRTSPLITSRSSWPM